MSCPSCDRRKSAGHYLCSTCWFLLPAAARTALYRRDDRATQRLLELRQQIDRGVPLGEIAVTP